MVETVILGPRLKQIGAFISAGAELADIGTDHAYLPIWLCERGTINKAVAVDIHEGPYLSAKNAVSSRKLEKLIDVRYGDGLKPVIPGEINTITIAGMGGNTMLNILAEKPEVLTYVNDIILQPQGAERKVRRTLLEQGWLIKDEVLVEEDGLIYVVMAYSKSKGHSLNEFREREHKWVQQIFSPIPDVQEDSKQIIAQLMWEFGPLLLDKPDELLRRQLKDHIKRLEDISEQIGKTRSEETLKKREAVLLEKFLVEEVYRWLYQSA